MSPYDWETVLYEGFWKDDEKHGFGKDFDENGEPREGWWKKGKFIKKM